MLGVGLRKLCPLDSFGDAFQEKKTIRKSIPRRVQNRPAGGPKWPLEGLRAALLCYIVGPNLAAKAARKPCLGGSGGALGTLVTLLEPSWGPPGASRAAPGRLLGVLFTPPKA